VRLGPYVAPESLGPVVYAPVLGETRGLEAADSAGSCCRAEAAHELGAEAAAQHYFKKPAAQLNAYEAARLAVMLPAPKRFERQVGSPQLAARAATVQARMPAVELP